jgi:hypothetical protein
MPIGKTLACVVVIVIACAMLSARAHPPGVADKDQAVAHEVEGLREFVKRAIAKKDVRALRAIYADSYTHTHGSGRVDGKDTRIASLLAGDPVIETAPVEDLKYSVFGNHTIVVTGKSPILNKAEDRNYDFRWIVVYVKARRDWQIAASQATRLP